MLAFLLVFVFWVFVIRDHLIHISLKMLCFWSVLSLGETLHIVKVSDGVPQNPDNSEE